MCERPPGSIDEGLLRALAALDKEQRREAIRLLYASLPWWRRARLSLRKCSRGKFGPMQVALLAPLLFLLGWAFWNAVGGWSATG